jgi:SRSO17 transposase
MDAGTFADVRTAFAAFQAHFAPLFGRKEARARGEQYLRGLLVQHADRRNAENVAEAVAEATPRTLQRLLTEAPWGHEAALAAVQEYLAPRLAAAEGVFILDESAFPKRGESSVGVARQWCGTLGKTASCQVGVFLAYHAGRGQALIDARLYLPKSWTADRDRCRTVGVPDDVAFATKGDLGLALLRAARERGCLTGRWVVADDWYGRSSPFRDALDTDGWWYMLDVPRDTAVFTVPAAVALPPRRKHGRTPTRLRLVPGASPPQEVVDLAAALSPEDWTLMTAAEGAQGPRRYRYAVRRIWESRDGLPGRAGWLVIRRNLDGSDERYALSNAPAEVTPYTLATVGATRPMVETLFRQAKGEAGLDEYEVRSWRGWHHHVALTLLAMAFLLTVQQDWGGYVPPLTVPQVSRLLRTLLPQRAWTLADLLTWLTDTQRRNARAKRSHAERHRSREPSL